MEKGQRTELIIEDMTNEGQGVGKSNGMAVFVRGAVVGDRVLAELTKVKKNYAFGRLIEILEPSPDRIDPVCRYSSQCGGCPYSAMTYESQLELKEKQVRDKLQRLGGIDEPAVRPIIGMEEPFRYRNKASMPVWTGGIITRKGGIVENLGEPAVGFYKAKSHEVVDCYDCLIQSEPAMAAAEALRQFMISDNITAYDPKWEKGLMRHLVVKTAFNTGEVMVVLVINGKGIPNAAKLVEMMDDYIYSLPETEEGVQFSLESVVVNVCKGKNGAMPGSIFGEECITLAGKPVIREELGGLQFEISPLSFYQVNPVQTVELYGKALEYADITGGETVLDLYCGVGTIGLFAAAAGAGRVIGIESVKGAVLDANRNAVINGIVNARYVCGKAEEELPKLVSGEIEDEGLRISRADVVFLDPPRAGCDEKLLETVASVGPEKIVYVSCDPATLARDVKYLTGAGYQFKEATPVDMFPWTG
ncbi:MAG: 23S rRNA (uracil(1939)-C(5))-methyltransferase RlmD, partial [Emergencia sp.]